MDYIYYTGDYVTYEGSLTGENGSYAEILSQSVKDSQEQIEFINSQLTEWSGKSGDSYGESSKFLINQFTAINKQITQNVKPACEAADKLKGELEKFKKADKEAAAAKKAWKDLGDEPSETKTVKVYNKETEKYDEKTEHNDAYDTWHAAKDDYETKLATDEKAKGVCDGLIAKIKALETALTDYTTLVNESSANGSIDLSGIKDFKNMTYEERKKFIDNLVEGYKKLYEDLKKYYDEHYKDGMPFDEKTMTDLMTVFTLFGVYDYYGYQNRYDILKNPEIFENCLTFCDENKLFEKLNAYAEGASWEESGLADLYKGIPSLFGPGDYGEIDVIDRMMSLIMI